MGKTISLRGAATGAYMRALRGEQKDALDEYRQLATIIHMEVKAGDLEGAAKKLRTFVEAKVAAAKGGGV